MPLRTSNRRYPRRFHFKHGKFWYVTSSTPRRWIALGADEGEALRKWAMLESGAELDTALTLQGVIKRYLRDVLPAKAPKTQKEQTRQAEKLIAVFGNALPDHITPVMIGEYLDRRGAKSPIAANREVALLSHIYTKALRWGYATTNPCRGIERNTETVRGRYITDDELRQLLAAAPASIRIAMLLAYYTGQRLGDLLALKWGQVENGLIKFVQGKTGAKVTVRISPPLQRVLDSIPRKSSWLVHTRHAKPYTDSGFESIFQRVKARAKLEDVHFHDIRAKAATDLDKSKTSIRDVQALLGHSSVTTTERYLKKLEQTESDAISVDVDIDVDTP